MSVVNMPGAIRNPSTTCYPAAREHEHFVVIVEHHTCITPAYLHHT